MKNDKIIKIIRVAKKYYESHMDQKVIAQEEGMSVSTVSRMLKKSECHEATRNSHDKRNKNSPCRG